MRKSKHYVVFRLRGAGIRPSETPYSQQGMSMIEVMVAMLVLGLGVLVLLSTQLRTVVGVRQAEQQTIVAQATQNLIEGMLANPVLTANASGNGWTDKSYANYIASASGVSSSCTDALDASSVSISKAALISAQVCEFKRTLATNLPDATIDSTICTDTSGAAPTVSGSTVNWRCNGTAGATFVKVIWQVDAENKNASGTSQASGVAMNGSKAVYTYQARITD